MGGGGGVALLICACAIVGTLLGKLYYHCRFKWGGGGNEKVQYNILNLMV